MQKVKDKMAKNYKPKEAKYCRWLDDSLTKIEITFVKEKESSDTKRKRGSKRIDIKNYPNLTPTEFMAEAKAQQEELTRMYEEMQGDDLYDPTLTFGSFLYHWYDTAIVTAPEDVLATSTKSGYLAHIKKIATRDEHGYIKAQDSIAEVLISDLQKRTVYVDQFARRFVASNPDFSPATFKRHFATYRNAINKGVWWKVFKENPLSDLSNLSLPKDEIKRGKPEVTAKLIDAIWEIAEGDNVEVALTIAIYTGFHNSELLGLRWSDIKNLESTEPSEPTEVHLYQTHHRVNGNPHHIRSPKNAYRSGMRCVLGNDVSLWLKEYKQKQIQLAKGEWSEDRPIISNHRGVAYTNNFLSRRMRKWRVQLADEFAPFNARTEDDGGLTFKRLRGAYATFLRHAHVDSITVRDAMGHSDEKTTKTYYDSVSHNDKVLAGNQLGNVIPFSRGQNPDEKNTMGE